MNESGFFSSSGCMFYRHSFMGIESFSDKIMLIFMKAFFHLFFSKFEHKFPSTHKLQVFQKER